MKFIRLQKLVVLFILSIAAYLPVSSFANTAVFQHCNYKGYAVNLPVGDYDLNDLRARGIKNDDLSAIKVSPGYEMTVYEHHHFTGRSLKFRASDSCLVDNGFNDIISSIKVRRISPPGKAIVYQHCGYKGYQVSLPSGNYDLKDLNRLGIKNDDLSSLRVSPGYEVLVYEHHHFGGRVLRFRADQHCLVNNNFNDIISSIKVRRAGPSGPGSTVKVYQHCNYAGYVAKLKPGKYNLSNLKLYGVRNDDLSAIKVPAGYEAIVYEHDNFRGRSLRFWGNDSCLVNNGFNDIISSIIIRRR